MRKPPFPTKSFRHAWLPVLLLALTGLWLSGADPAQAQCLSESECAALKSDVRELRTEVRQLRRQLRDLHREARDLPRDSPERRAIRDRARTLRRQLRETRHEGHPLLRRYRAGCKNC